MGNSIDETPDLPDWAISIWESLGKPEVTEDILTGPLIDRRAGLRRDDLVEILLDSRALPEDSELWVRGRLIGTNKMSVEILDSDGAYRYVSRDAIVEVRLIAHMRPAYIDDSELLQYEREDQKRRAKLHEDAEKETKGGGDEHIWG
ncbi:MAG: hypothetical protein VX320_00435 [Candidatus Thermoplasmatota archaeon]|nr:hypothetical protein [Candidatus Thermoplasmatota archaeon]